MATIVALLLGEPELFGLLCPGEIEPDSGRSLRRKHQSVFAEQLLVSLLDYNVVELAIEIVCFDDLFSAQA